MSNLFFKIVLPSFCYVDELLMCISKFIQIFYRDFQLRHCAVLGFIEMLCSVRLDSITTLSQDTNIQDSWPGLFTQVIICIYHCIISYSLNSKYTF